MSRFIFFLGGLYNRQSYNNNDCDGVMDNPLTIGGEKCRIHNKKETSSPDQMEDEDEYMILGKKTSL